ncbi:hypothetical protein OESDEN_20415 [Oesophagostomum dentatum]|uniref:Proteasome activator Blm10 mid region domain-containing protein n=1 Tax=Oesophagostomum dentatum TaxID=61180 RepID=A0A0B1S3I6_OESDE|nr:hypothetical protein OESDEN_20415 [Oesophagostomum dentatum]
MTMLVYRTFSKGISADATLDNSTYSASMLLDDTVGTLSGPSQEMTMPDENNPIWKRSKVFLECVVVMWMSMRKALLETKYVTEKQKLDNLETKVFKKLFQCFRTTSLIGTTMLIGSMLPPSSMDGITQSVLSLLNEKVVDESIMEPYLDATAQWRIEYLFDIINSGLSILQTEISVPEHSPPNKKKKSKELPPVDRLRKALRYLRYLLRSYSTNQLITCSYLYQLEQFYKKLSMIRHVIDLRLSRELSDVGIPDDLIVEAFEMKQTLAAILLNCKDRGEDDKDHIIRFTTDMCDELRWFETDVLSNLAALYSDDIVSFLIRLSEIVLRCIGLTMAAWDFSKPLRTPSGSETHIEGESSEDHLSYPDIAGRVVMAFCSSSTPGDLLPAVLTAAKQLLDNGCTMFSHLLPVLDYVPKWIMTCTANDDTLKEKEVGDAYLALWRTFLDHSEYTETLLDKSINVCAVHLLNYLTQHNEDNHDIQDPRLHDFETTMPISIILNRVIFRNKTLIT